jgi:putative transposase
MPRQKRIDAAGTIYHALNRGDATQTILHKHEDFDTLVRVPAEGLRKYLVQLYSFTMMPNHWQLVLRPTQDGQINKFLRWVMATHSLRYHEHYHTRGEGHICPSRYTSFPIQDDTHF